MKYITLLILTVTFTSCTKNYTCTCITKVASFESKNSSTLKTTKKKALSECKKYEKTNSGSSVTCNIN